MYKILIIAVLVAILAVLGCNIFSPLYPGGGDSVEDLITSGDNAYNNANFEIAMTKYKTAIGIDGRSSQARWGYFKALCRVRFIDFLNLAQAYASKDTLSTILNNRRIIDYITGDNGVFNEAIKALGPIIRGECDGVISSSDVSLNLNLAIAYFGPSQIFP